MNIVATEFSLSTGSIDIYISGCKAPHCKGCHNKELWPFTLGEPYNKSLINKLSDKVTSFPSLVKNIMIFGGEPLDSPDIEIITLLLDLKKLNLPIWLFTRYNMSEINKEIINNCDYIKTGEYDETKLTDDNIQFDIELASSNQQIHKLK